MEHALNDEQARAVAHQEGPLLIVAGAGAGKTRVIVERIAELIRTGARPEEILAVTFTNKAAREMGERVRSILESDATLRAWNLELGTPFIGTFHALSLHMLKSFHAAAGLKKRFVIFDRSESLRAVKEAVQGVGFDPKQLEPRQVLAAMSRAKGDDISLEAFRAQEASYRTEAIADVWERYEAILKKEQALDFDDILVRALALLRERADIREHFQKAWSYIHVDEYQDVNRIQYELVKILGARHRNIAVVGDADQNIYSWRGASIEHLLDFERDYKDATIVTLTHNYRSTKTILKAANDAIQKNSRRREKILVTDNHDGEPISVGGFASEVGEAYFVAGEAAHRISQGEHPNSIAVLYRANFQSRILEEAFLKTGVPYQVLGTRFFERMEVKDALAYLRAALVRSPSDIARAVNAPPRGIGKVTLAKLVIGGIASLTGVPRVKAEQFYALLDRIAEAAEKRKPSDTIRFIIEESGMAERYRAGKGEDEERLENLEELVTVATKYDSFEPERGIDALLEEAALQSEQDELSVRERVKKNGVKLMTVHAAKGLEFDSVFVTGLEHGLFPHERDDERGDDEEERRLFYVALTRARRRVYLTYALTRMMFGSRTLSEPSEFIAELDPALCTLVGGNTARERIIHI